MTTVRVNLLPEATKAKGAADRQKAVVGVCAVALLGAMAGTWFWMDGRVQDAQAELATEQARTGELSTEVNALSDFSSLQARQQQSQQLLAETLIGEVSYAGFLQDVASVVPSDSQVEQLTINLDPEATTSDPREGQVVGTFSITGKTLTSHAPGVERFLLEFGKVASFRDLYLNTSQLEEPDLPYATFSLDGRVGLEALTGRYILGIPEELR